MIDENPAWLTVKKGATVGRSAPQSARFSGSCLENQQYTGSKINPTPKLYTMAGKTKLYLTEGTDYEIIGYYNNIKKGTATVLIRGIRDYSGVKSISFKIAAADNNLIWSGAF